MRRADLSAVDFGDANLTGARLQASDLAGAILRGADLTRSNLADARFDAALTTDVRYCRTTMPSGQVRRAHCSGG